MEVAGESFELAVGHSVEVPDGCEELDVAGGEATTAMDSISVSHLLMVFAIILANIGVLYDKFAGGNN